MLFLVVNLKYVVLSDYPFITYFQFSHLLLIVLLKFFF